MLKHTNNKCELIDEALEKTKLTEKKTFGFWDYPLQKSVRFLPLCAPFYLQTRTSKASKAIIIALNAVKGQ